ncbi:phosphohydrolase [Actinoplanes sp. SE50]|uniref:HD domain-containing protein n=1 Tax=unclassified Actinoplanes TaxID=2626549 RepID=UPI00023ED61D|nr:MULTISPECIES: HD domain-containing protein [unclassified Actinoplanes]AEV85033.1 2',3'-cyclic-nucleotide 2'-phosphodiesterase [Actinoplanes sp. SE50/110]ATO83424.1 phosphohydrolase [Actinoplanes sp. SE50]SLM00831.1 phosphohydrolase [Actinoplanes sp. SE50/110]
MWIPSDAEIRQLHERVAPTPEAFDLVWTHCEIVCRIAEQLMARRELGVDPDLVRAGCLLHDIGVYRLYGRDGVLDYPNYIRHGLLGHQLLEAQGWPDYLCRFCSCHTGVGVTRADVLDQGLPLPPGDYVAETPEETLVMYADKFHSKKNPPVFVSAAAYTVSVARFGPGKAQRFGEMVTAYGEPDLLPLATGYGHRLTA